MNELLDSLLQRIAKLDDSQEAHAWAQVYSTLCHANLMVEQQKSDAK